MLLTLRGDDFFSSAAENVTSQLRQRLTSAFYSTSALAREVGVQNSAAARDHLSAVNQELFLILRMVTQLSRCGDQGAARCHMSSVDLVQCLQTLASEVEELCRSVNVAFSLELGERQLILMADQDQLAYLILSLLSNALKSVPDQNGRVTLSLKRQQNQAVITLADNGGGFSPDLLTHPLWNRPTQLLLGRGLGLGLPLAQRIAAAHDGALMVFPSPKGSRVVLSLPIQPPDQLFSQPKPPLDRSGGFSMARVMLADALPRSLYFPSSGEED